MAATAKLGCTAGAGDSSDGRSNLSDAKAGAAQELYEKCRVKKHGPPKRSHHQPDRESTHATPVEGRDSDTSEANRSSGLPISGSGHAKATRCQRISGPEIRDITDEQEAGYDGDNEGQLPDEYEEASGAESDYHDLRHPEVPSSSSDEHDKDNGKIHYEDTLIHRFRRLSTRRPATYQGKRHNRLKRRHSPSLSSDERARILACPPVMEDGRSSPTAQRMRKRIQGSWSGSAHYSSTPLSDSVMDIDMVCDSWSRPT